MSEATDLPLIPDEFYVERNDALIESPINRYELLLMSDGDFEFWAKDSLSDAGNSERTKRLFGSDLIYVTQLRSSFVGTA